MVFIKGSLLSLVFGITTFLGLMIANRYKERVKDLKSMLSALNIFETKIKYTYEPLPHIFEDIANKFKGSVGEIFYNTKNKMKLISADEAWEYSIENSNTNMNKEDLSIIKNLKNMLGKTDVEGQLSEIELMKNFIEIQIEKSE